MTLKAQLRRVRPRPRMTAEEIDTLVRGLGSILAVLCAAEPLDKAEIHSRVGLPLTYQPGENTMIAEARPPAIMYGRFVSEDRARPRVHDRVGGGSAARCRVTV